jgi:hypothetical protein
MRWRRFSPIALASSPVLAPAVWISPSSGSEIAPDAPTVNSPLSDVHSNTALIVLRHS